jgi:hypothetical protein
LTSILRRADFRQLSPPSFRLPVVKSCMQKERVGEPPGAHCDACRGSFYTMYQHNPIPLGIQVSVGLPITHFAAPDDFAVNEKDPLPFRKRASRTGYANGGTALSPSTLLGIMHPGLRSIKSSRSHIQVRSSVIFQAQVQGSVSSNLALGDTMLDRATESAMLEGSFSSKKNCRSRLV